LRGKGREREREGKKMKHVRIKMKMRIPRFVEKSAFLRQTWALLKRNVVLHVFISLELVEEVTDCRVDGFSRHFHRLFSLQSYCALLSLSLFVWFNL
jgi:hypothetical protein